ncbi:MAG TPA: cytochrome c oxidase subunit II [Acidimicrobiales bacterium]|nr:cytochrome c oxidase subunit II [Acidimicrobiales bacterium]
MDSPALSPQGVTARTGKWRRVRRAAALPLAALALSGCTVPSFGANAGDTTSSRSVFHLWQGFSLGAVVIGALVLLLLAWAMVKYRRKSDAIPVQSQYHIPLELTYTIVPILIVFGLFAATLVVENKEVANPATKVTIDVNAFQWGWKFSYPGTNAVVVGQTTQDPVMVMPVNTDVHINLTSTDVIHGFYVKAFNFSRYALPGIDNQFTFRAVNTGTFFGQCTQLCGLYHSLMFFKVKVVSASAYQAWLAGFTNASAAAAATAAQSGQSATYVPTKVTNSSGVK